VLRRRCWLAGGVLWFFLWLIPTNSLMPRLDSANDRHLYPALIGLVWLIGLISSRWRWQQPVLLTLFMLFSIATLVRNEDYRSAVALWSRTSEQSPNKSRVWNNLGVACQQAGDRQCAETAFSTALALDPDDVKAGNNLYFLRHKQ
jgi:tetratricopeptide (TPR) repeat protein